MRLAVVGSRNFTNAQVIYNFLDNFCRGKNIQLVVSGGARGVDRIASSWAKSKNIDVLIIRPDYDKYPPKIAPIIRNREIVNKSDFVLSFWDGKSRGTKFVIDYCKQVNKPNKIVFIDLLNLNKNNSNGYSL